MISQQAHSLNYSHLKTSVRNQILVKEKRSVAGGHPAALTIEAALTTCQVRLHLKPMSVSSDVKRPGEASATFILVRATIGTARFRHTENVGLRPVVLTCGNLELSRSPCPIQQR
jgi:hypothetical protein